MTVYQTELNRIRKSVYSNQDQILKVIRIKNYIEHNYHTDINLDLISKVNYVSKYHLIRLFKKYYGLTPRHYLIDTRIEKSKKHLKSGISVTETCFAVGFESLGSFSTLFKKKTGKSPSQYQKEQFSRSKRILNF